jgi:hypothetical protein
MHHEEPTEHSAITEGSSKPQEQLQLQDHHGDNATEPPRKKSLSFKLAFAGLALLLLVFQVDATCLSIALAFCPYFGLTSNLDYLWRAQGHEPGVFLGKLGL